MLFTTPADLCLAASRSKGCFWPPLFYAGSASCGSGCRRPLGGTEASDRFLLTRAAWRRAAPIEDYRTIRSAMVDDLLRRYSFRSWGPQQVIELLGEPDADPAKVGFPGWDLAYFLGLERGDSFSLDDEYLLFRFGASGEVAEFRTGVN